MKLVNGKKITASGISDDHSRNRINGTGDQFRI